MNSQVIVKKRWVRVGAVILVVLALVGVTAAGALAGGFPVMSSLTCDAQGNGQLCFSASGIGTVKSYINGVQMGLVFSNWLAQCYPATLNPGDVFKVQIVETGQSLTTTCGSVGTGCTDDGRVNQNCAAPVVVYCSESQIDFYLVDQDGGTFSFRLKADDLAKLKPGTEPVLVKQVGSTKVYLMPDGSFKMLAPQSDGKTYYLFWDHCSPYAEGAGW